MRHLMAGVLLITSSITLGRVQGDEEKAPFARWEKAIAAFEAADRDDPPPQQATLFVGSSSIRKWDLEKWFPERPVINRGFGGSQIADSVHFAERIVLKHRPKTIVFYAGDNDIAKKKSPRQVAEDFREFVKIVHAELPKTKILFIAIKPSLSRWNLGETMQQANRLIEKQCRQNDRLEFVDVWPKMLGSDGKPRPELFVQDGLHLSEAGYKLWTSLVKPHLPEAD